MNLSQACASKDKTLIQLAGETGIATARLELCNQGVTSLLPDERQKIESIVGSIDWESMSYSNLEPISLNAARHLTGLSQQLLSMKTNVNQARISGAEAGSIKLQEWEKTGIETVLGLKVNFGGKPQEIQTKEEPYAMPNLSFGEKK